MDAIATWQLSINGMGTVQAYTYDFPDAGGSAVAVFGTGAGADWSVYNVGNGEAAFSVTVYDENLKGYTYYWNSHYATEDDPLKNGGMMLWNGSNPGYSSDTVGPEQTFRMVNLGQGQVSLQATAGAFAGQYLSAARDGWFPVNYQFGTGSFLATASPVAFRISGDLLPMVRITNSAYDTDFTGRDFGPFDLTGTNLQKCNLTGASLVSVPSIASADFTSATLHGTHLGAHNLATAKTWTHADFTGSDLTSVAGASPGHFESAVFDNTNLTGRDFTGAFLQGASFKGATLTGTIFTGARLDGANFTGAHLDGTILHGAVLEGAHLDHVDLSTAQFDSATTFTRAETARTTFLNSTVPFAVLASNWSYLDLSDATITGIPTAITKLVADHALLPDGLSLQGVDLTGASFVGARMYKAELQKANLHAAVLTSARLKGAKLTGANLTLARLDGAYLIVEETADDQTLEADKREPAMVTDAFLFNTVLDAAHCDGVDFSGSLFVTATAISASQSASAVGASMNHAKFDGAGGAVVQAVFNGAQLSAASFAGTPMVGASFQDNGPTATQLTPSSGINHTPASVHGADIRGVNFTGANLDGLDMQDATYSTASGSFEKIYVGFGGTKVPVAFTYAATELGDTTKSTVCPNGKDGPCALPTQ